ncbi:MAG: TetR/AcrR family transcriptional regulator [Pseudomonadota bacterium]
MNVQRQPDPAEKAPIKRGRKYHQVIAGAREVFLAAGFEGASVDDIAKAAGVSKATLYAYFPDKRLLFMEVASIECRRQTDDAMEELDMSRPPSEVLSFAAQRMMNFILSPFGRGVFRIVVAETERFPEIGREFWLCGPQRGREILADYFREASARGELKIDDYRLAADQFSELCKADVFPRMIFGIAREFSAEERRRVAEGAVEMFLARYGAERPGLPASARDKPASSQPGA